MLDKQLARKLAPLVKNKKEWEPLEEYLNSLKNLELQVLVAATSEQEMFRSQGKMSLLGRLLELPQVLNEVLERKENG
jgi:hypothetical protein